MREQSGWRKTLVVWRRFGKEHGEGTDFKLNPPEVVSTHIQQKIEKFRQTPAADWRWWQLSDEVLIEKPRVDDICYGPDTRIYYLPLRNWTIVENIRYPSMNEKWKWYVHIGDIIYDRLFDCWIFTDLFADIIIKEDKRTHSVLDLDELGNALKIGLITPTQIAHILTDTQRLVDLVRRGDFPPPELCGCRKILDELDWKRRG